ncbi:MAG: HAMP domain-containing sensor histidine kinase, partial [Leeuwenhoekiella sp.]
TWIGTNTQIQKLKEEEKRKEDFLKLVSHELKTPVTSVKGYVQLLLSMINSSTDRSIDSIPLKSSLERIDSQVTRLTRLISELLDLSRLEESKLELKKEIFEISELVENTIKDIKLSSGQANIVASYKCECNVFADKDRIGQVLINFITNAIKYSPNNKNIIIELYRSDADNIAVSVTDQGIGIERENQSKIFDRFFRVSGKNEETYAGFGIGLYLAKDIVERHKGTVEVQSKIGAGSTFIFTLPILK